MKTVNIFELFNGLYRWTCTLDLTDENKRLIENNERLNNGLYTIEDFSPFLQNNPSKIIFLGIGLSKGSKYAAQLY